MAEYEKLRQRAKRSRSDSYLQYLSREGIEAPESALAEDLVKIDTDAALNAPKYGVSGEALAEGGLSDDGYAGYLEKLARDETNLGYARAYHKSRLAEYRAKGGYSRYLARYDTAQEKIAEGVLERIKKDRIFNSSSAISLAVDAGLSPENAEIAVSRGIAAGRQEAIRDIIAYSRKKGFYAYTAKLYALNSGLDERAAQIVYNAIRSGRDYNLDFDNLSAEEYLEILKERAESQDID